MSKIYIISGETSNGIHILNPNLENYSTNPMLMDEGY